MNPVTEFVKSGVLELYVMGSASPEEALLVEQMAAANPEVKQELEQLSEALEQYAQTHAVTPRASVKALLMATIDYLERMKQGELPESPPLLTPQSQIGEYSKWVSSEEAVLPDNAADIYARIIGYTPTATTAIIWVRGQTDEEVHHDEYERFLILEGTCNMQAGAESYQLGAGDYFSIPLHTPHQLTVTSEVPCKAILQRLSVV